VEISIATEGGLAGTLFSAGAVIAGVVISVVAGLAWIQDTITTALKGLAVGGTTVSISIIAIVADLMTLPDKTVTAFRGKTIATGVRRIGISIIALFTVTGLGEAVTADRQLTGIGAGVVVVCIAVIAFLSASIFVPDKSIAAFGILAGSSDPTWTRIVIVGIAVVTLFTKIS
jgi:hypothetical protein